MPLEPESPLNRLYTALGRTRYVEPISFAVLRKLHSFIRRDRTGARARHPSPIHSIEMAGPTSHLAHVGRTAGQHTVPSSVNATELIIGLNELEELAARLAVKPLIRIALGR